ncbi:MAG: hypothetical protein LBU53_09520 [Zoogloeaceae bacterium]|nr:hypothetical protein [Zoogloeaceae bacterium]
MLTGRIRRFIVMRGAACFPRIGRAMLSICPQEKEMRKAVAVFDKAKRRYAGWMSEALSTAGRWCANIGQTLWWLLLALVSPMVEGASLIHPAEDVRATLAIQEPVVIMAKNEIKQDRAIGICRIMVPPYIEPISESGEHVISPVADASLYFFNEKKLTYAVVSKYFETAKVTWLELPKHGKLFDENNNIVSVFKDLFYYYAPDVGYVGKDKIVAMVEIMREKIKVVYYLHDVGSEGYEGQPCKDYYWIISHPSVEDYNTPASWHRMEGASLIHPAEDVRATLAPAVLVAAAPEKETVQVFGYCEVSDEGGLTFSLANLAQHILAYEKQKNPSLPTGADVRIIKKPTYGQLKQIKTDHGDFYSYVPNNGYLGKEHFEAIISVWNGETVRIVVNIIVQSEPVDSPEFDLKKFCPVGIWKISQPSPEDYNTPASWYRVEGASLSHPAENVRATLAYMPSQEMPVVLAQTSSGTTTPQADYILKNCQHTADTSDPRSAVRWVDPAGMLQDYMQNQNKNKRSDIVEFKPVLLQGTKHGKLTEEVSKDASNYGRIAYYYDPDNGYLGNDQAIFMVEFQGNYYKVVVDLKVVGTYNDYDDDRFCPPPRLIRVNNKSISDASGINDYNPPPPLGIEWKALRFPTLRRMSALRAQISENLS